MAPVLYRFSVQTLMYCVTTAVYSTIDFLASSVLKMSEERYWKSWEEDWTSTAIKIYEKLKDLRLLSSEHINHRSHPYKVQPENQGKLIFISGASGSGKSTTALKLAQKEGFVYYEVDGFMSLRNPYIPLDAEEPSLATSKQKRIRGTSKEDLSTYEGFYKLMAYDLAKGDLTQQEAAFPFFKLMSKDIATEKKKIGGDWVVAFAVPTRKIRDVIKEECNATFVVLTVSEETQMQRLSKRHPKDKEFVNYLAKCHNYYESVQSDEKDAYEVIITPDMEQDDVLQQVIDLISEKTPWKQGVWMKKSDEEHVHVIKGYDVFVHHLSAFLDHQDMPVDEDAKGKWTFGSFGEAPEELRNKTGQSHYNVELFYNYKNTKEYGILNEDGTCCFVKRDKDDSYKEFHWIDKDELKKISDAFEFINNRSHPYKVQPENQGKLIFISGAPGCGKSTTALKLAQKEGFVYYEGDGFAFLRNPYIPLDVEEPGHATFKQKRIRGLSKEGLLSFSGLEKLFFLDLPKGDLTGQEEVFPFFKAMSKDIATEKKKIGGNWAVAFAVPTRKMRDVIKEECNATFVVLTVSKDTQQNRISRRHQDDKDEAQTVDYLTSIHKCYESVLSDEKDAYELTITPDMDPDDVVQKVLDLIKNTKPSQHKNSKVCILI